MLRKSHFLVFLLLIVSACKTQQSVTENQAKKELTTKQLIQKHYTVQKHFKTLNIRASAKYSDTKQSHSFSTDIRIQKDTLIWINAKLLGFPVAKALITPTQVSYYEKINGTYFEGNYDLLSNWLGTDLDFQKVQNLFIGEALDDLTKNQYITSIADGLYKLTEKKKTVTQKEFYFEAANYLIKKELIAQPNENRSLELNYPSFTKQNEMYLPNEIIIEAKQKKEVKIEIQYKSITFDESLNTSFSIPNGYQKIK